MPSDGSEQIADADDEYRNRQIDGVRFCQALTDKPPVEAAAEKPEKKGREKEQNYEFEILAQLVVLLRNI